MEGEWRAFFFGVIKDMLTQEIALSYCYAQKEKR